MSAKRRARKGESESSSDSSGDSSSDDEGLYSGDSVHELDDSDFKDDSDNKRVKKRAKTAAAPVREAKRARVASRPPADMAAARNAWHAAKVALSAAKKEVEDGEKTIEQIAAMPAAKPLLQNLESMVMKAKRRVKQAEAAEAAAKKKYDAAKNATLTPAEKKARRAAEKAKAHERAVEEYDSSPSSGSDSDLDRAAERTRRRDNALKTYHWCERDVPVYRGLFPTPPCMPRARMPLSNHALQL